MLLHCSYYIIIFVLFPCYLWAYGPMLLPVHFPHLSFFWALFDHISAVPAHFIPRASSAYLLLLYLFYSYGFLLNLLDFLSLTTTSLPLITFQAYWLLSQPYKFTNSYLGLPNPFTSYYSHRFTTSFLGLSRTIYFFFNSFYFCGPSDHYSYHSGLLGFALLIFSSYFLHIVGLLLPLGLLAKVGINR